MVASTSASQPAVTVRRLSSSSAYSVPTRQLAAEVEGKHTEVVIQEYHDRTFVIVTQLGRVGVVIQASLPADTPYIPFSSSTPPNFEDEDEDHESESSASHPNGSSSTNPLFPPINPSLVQTSLLGTPPPGQTSLYALYVSSIHSILRPVAAAEQTSPSAETHDEPKDLRPVIVGLGLALHSQQGGEEDDQQGEGMNLLADLERGRFFGVLDLVRRCKANLS